jgi:hypothetical protein
MAPTSLPPTADSTRVIEQVFGAATSIVLALSPLFYLLARQNDLEGK